LLRRSLLIIICFEIVVDKIPKLTREEFLGFIETQLRIKEEMEE